MNLTGSAFYILKRSKYVAIFGEAGYLGQDHYNLYFKPWASKIWHKHEKANWSHEETGQNCSGSGKIIYKMTSNS